MGLLACLSVLSAGVASAQAVSYQAIPPLQRVYSIYNAAMTDQFFTTSVGEAQYFLSSGGWANTGDVIYLEPYAQPNTTTPLYGLIKGAPQNEHFYTTNASDVTTLVNQYGYVSTGIIGHIYKEQVPGSIALHRLNRYNGATGDLVHRYTVSTSLVSSLQSQGYTYEGITGYVYQTEFPTVANGHIFGARCDATGCSGPSYRNSSFGSYRSVASIGAKPAGATRQVMRFQFWTPDMFDMQSPIIPTNEHLVISPRGRLQVNLNDLLAGSLHGISLVITAGDHGCPRSSAFIEEFWPVTPSESNQPHWGGYNFTDYSLPSACSTGFFQNRIWYDVTLTVTDGGTMTYAIRLLSGSMLATRTITYGTAALTSTGVDPDAAGWFDAQATGYFMTNAQSSKRNYTAYVTNLSVTWE